MASWGKQIASGFKLVIQCLPSIVLASVFIFDAAADTNTVTDGNSDTDADTGIFTNTNIVTNRPTENYMPLRYAGMLHVIRYASSGMLLGYLEPIPYTCTDAVMETDPETDTDGDILSWLVLGGQR